MLSYVIQLTKARSHLPLPSGSHPFDNDLAGSSSDWLSHIQASHCSQVSQNYRRNEARLKAKIIEGEVEFDDHPWNRLPDG
jgi:hypothetical protein